ncbi:MAG: hypothetical protein H0U76_00200 [Ktedonobacteraceae bacterium]|nr:hypothetical protein [Ktedonobacteraceae bacterium]
MGIQETKRRQEEQLAAKAEGQQKQPSTQSQPTAQPVIDMQTLRQVIENVVRAELQGIRSEQPQPLDMHVVQQAVRSVMHAELQTMRDEQPRSQQQAVVDMQALQHAVQLGVRAELQPLQTAVTIMANAIQAQTDALIVGEGDEEDQEQDEPLPTALTRRTDEDIEDEQVYPPDEELGDDEALDDVGDEDEEGEDEEGYPAHPPRPESPTHRLRRPGPVGILLGSGDSFHPSTGPRRWEPVV